MWTNCIDKLINFASEIMKNKEFESPTRQAALELISSLAEAYPVLLKKVPEKLKTEFFPALCIMLTEVEDQDDLPAWAEKEEEDAIAKDDPASVAAETLARIAEDLGEKLIVNCSTQLI
jgi:hypothetical protein